jgi:hypothetical protein
MSLNINLTNVQSKAVVVSTNQTAVNDGSYTVVANSTFTDPSPLEGKGYRVFVRNGTATINAVAYTEGTTIFRVFHSGAWVSYVSLPDSNFVPTTRTINGLDLSANRTLTASDVGAPSGSGSSTNTNTGDETQSTILSKLGWFKYNRVSEVSITTLTTETILDSVLIPAGTFTNGGMLKIENGKFRIVGTAGNKEVKIYIGPNAGNLTSATQIALLTVANTSLYASIQRKFTCTTTALQGIAFNVSSNNDDGANNNVRGTVDIDWTVEQHVHVTGRLLNGADLLALFGLTVKNF